MSSEDPASKAPATGTACHCGATLSHGARFCPRCGQPSRKQARTQARDLDRSLRSTRRDMQAVTIVFVGTLLGLIALALLSTGHWSWTSVSLAETLIFLAVGAAAVSRFDRHRWQRTLGSSPSSVDMMIGLAVGLIGAGVSYSYVRLLVGDTVELDPSGESLIPGLVAFALLPAVFEEWLCRGVLWEALRRITPTTGTILITAGLFALLHVPLAGGWALVPHRFVLGALLGWARARSDSLLPAIGGHALHNALFVVAV